MSRTWPALLFVFATSASFADDYDRVDGPILAELPSSPGVRTTDRLTAEELGRLPNVLKGTSAAFVVVKTDQGNLARLLVALAFRKGRDEAAEPVAILAVDRFDTFEMPGARKRIAHGKGLSLFDGFRFDLDSGQVVPDGQGGDLRFETTDDGTPGIVALEGSHFYTLESSPLPTSTAKGQPSAGRVVAPADFNGRYRLFANGQWTGTLDVTATDGDVTGRLRSEQTGTSYPITGQVGSPSNRIRFTVELPRTKQEYDGLLFTDGKGAIAGTTTLLDRPYGFFALREDGRIVPEGEEQEPIADVASPRGRFVAEIADDGTIRKDGQALDSGAFAERLKAARDDEPETWVLLQANPAAPYRIVAATVRAVREAGIEVIRLEAVAAPDRR